MRLILKTIAAALLLTSTAAYADIKIGAVLSVTGPASFLGDPEKKTLEPVAGAGGISSQDRASWALEGAYAQSWATTIWADMLA